MESKMSTTKITELTKPGDSFIDKAYAFETDEERTMLQVRKTSGAAYTLGEDGTVESRLFGKYLSVELREMDLHTQVELLLKEKARYDNRRWQLVAATAQHKFGCALLEIPSDESAVETILFTPSFMWK